MPYTPPSRNAVNLVVGGEYTPPSRSAVDMQLGDDPLLVFPPNDLIPNVNSMTIRWDPEPILSFNPHADDFLFQRSENGTDWMTVEGVFWDGEYTDENLLEGHRYWYRTIVRTNLQPTPKEAISEAVDGWTDYMLEVIECKDAANNILANALIIAVPAEELLEGVAQSASGQDWPNLSYKRCNRTDSTGTCSIRIPGGTGPAAVLMVPEDEETGGDILVPVDTAEEG